MPKLTLQSPKFPAISIPVPHCPGTNEQGSFTFVVGHEYHVTEDTAAAVKRLVDQFPPPYNQYWSYQISQTATEKSKDKLPPPPPKAIAPEPEPLTPDDDDLVSVEVAKLEGEKLAVSIPRLQNTALNPDFSLELRINYLERVLAHPNLAKGLKNEANSLIKQINPEPETEADSE